MKRVLTIGLASLIATGATLVLSTAAQATTPPAPVCKSVASDINGHNDGGHHGTWANDTFKRTVKICETSQGNYEATVTDKGFFVTVTGFSPRQGLPIPAGIKGTFSGGFSIKFKAITGFSGYQGNHPGYGISSSLGTGKWIAAVWGPGVEVPDATDWHWVYTSCSETWLDKAPSDGTLLTDGDITGKTCPSHSPSPSPSKSVNTGPTSSSKTASAVPTSTSLPVTGTPVLLIFGIGAALLIFGATVVYWARKRRVNFRA